MEKTHFWQMRRIGEVDVFIEEVGRGYFTATNCDTHAVIVEGPTSDEVIEKARQALEGRAQEPVPAETGTR